MRRLSSRFPLFAFVFTAALVPLTASAAEFTCKGESVEKSGSTHYRVKTAGADHTVEKSGSTRGRARKSGSRYTVEASGSTLATIEGGKIFKSGATWATVAEAQKTYDCPDVIAATLWVLQKSGKL